jgi:hypothetical protein
MCEQLTIPRRIIKRTAKKVLMVTGREMVMQEPLSHPTTIGPFSLVIFLSALLENMDEPLVNL